MTRLHVSAIALATFFTSYCALAQQASATGSIGLQGQANAEAAAQPAPPPPPPTGVNADANAQANQQTQAGMALPTATNANAPVGNSDHDDMVGHLGVGYLGRATIPYGLYQGAATPQAPVPVIGVRYWMNPLLGLDLGAGLWIGGTSTDVSAPNTPTISSDGPKPTAFVLHAGVPLALASSRHFSFQVIPEANFGYAKVSQDAVLTANNLTKQAGTHLDLGARVGAEIHFGFMGIPQLSLVGSVGLRFNYDKHTYDTTPPGGPGGTRVSTGAWDISTTVNESPWNIFISNVGAFYYF